MNHEPPNSAESTTLATASDPHHGERAETEAAPSTAHDAVVEDLLVEEISIDGMCGVY